MMHSQACQFAGSRAAAHGQPITSCPYHKAASIAYWKLGHRLWFKHHPPLLAIPEPSEDKPIQMVSEQ